MTGNAFFERLAASPLADGLDPRLASAFRDYLKGEKVLPFHDQWVINTHFPPFPSRAFENMIGQMHDGSGKRALFSVTLAVTNRCPFNCWHCYNAGRSQRDLSIENLRALAADLQRHGACTVSLTGGEPLLRSDLEEICAAFDGRTSLLLGTTGYGLTAERARALKSAGIFAMGISLDSAAREEHDAMRGFSGAFDIALKAIALAEDAGIYPYIVSTATRDFLKPERFYPFMDFAGKIGAREVHLLEPCATGRLAHDRSVTLTPDERALMIRYQHEIAARDDLSALSTFTYLESPEAFGCGAGLTHLYIDGAGELCPCNLVPLSFGNVAEEGFDALLDRLAAHFTLPRSGCIGHAINRAIEPGTPLPLPREASEALCTKCLPREHGLPRFFAIRQTVRDNPHQRIESLAGAYDRIHADYDDFWSLRAGLPAQELVDRLPWSGGERVFEAGCGSGVATLVIARHLNEKARFEAADISEGMQSLARRRLADAGVGGRAEFIVGDALEALRARSNLDRIISTWVLGYIPLTPFIEAAAQALAPGGLLAFIVHRHNSPRREFNLFTRIAARDPSVLLHPVEFGFPRDAEHVDEELRAAGFTPIEIWQGTVTFPCATPEAVLEHLLKSGAGTVFYEAVDPTRREALTAEFLNALRADPDANGGFDVRHDYVACIARRES